MRSIVIGGTCSGVGKSSIALGLMAAFSRRGFTVQPFKIGPDFLDPLHHKAAAGRECFNLDSWILGRDAILACFRRFHSNTDIAIIEGVMGLYDGHTGSLEKGSTAEMAKLLGTPVLLVLDCWHLARSAAAMIQGYTTFDLGVKFAGVIFNKVTGPDHTAWLTEAVLSTNSTIPVFGGIPMVEGIELEYKPSVIANKEDDSSYIKKLADLVERYVNLDAVLEEVGIFEQNYASESSGNYQLINSAPLSVVLPKHARIGVASDSAFCFYYHENLSLFQDAGAELVYFSPLQDTLPSCLDAIYFGGGYLEKYLEQLSANKQLLYAIRAFADAGGVIYGESAGLMYLSQGVEGLDLQVYPMCSVFPFWTRLRKCLRTGYVMATARSCAIFPVDVGEIRGFMYNSSDILWPDNSFNETCLKGFAVKDEHDGAKEEWEGYMHLNTLASPLHLHFGSNPAAVKAFVQRCRVDQTKAAAVAAASASAVAAAGPRAAAAAGAAAAAAVTAASGTPVPFKPSYYADVCKNCMDLSVDDLECCPSFSVNISNIGTRFSDHDLNWLGEDLALRRSASFDLDCLNKTRMNRSCAKLSRSELEIWDKIPKSRNDLEDLNHVEHEYGRSIRDGKRVLFFREKMSFGRRKPRIQNMMDVNTFGLSTGKTVWKSQTREHSQIHGYPHRQKCDRTLSESKYTARRNYISSYRSECLENVFPRNIVSLMPSATEILMDLGVGDRLRGITDSCDRPYGVQYDRHIVAKSRVDAVSIPNRKVETLKEWGPYLGLLRARGGRIKLDISWLSKYKPDLIIISEDAEQQCDGESMVAALAQAGLHSGRNFKVLNFSPRTVSEVLGSIMDLGDAVGLYQEACLLVELLKSRLRNVAAAVALQGCPRILLLQGLDPLFLGGHWIPEVEMLAGAFDGLQKPGCGIEMVHWQRIVLYAPEVLVLAPCSLSISQTLSEVEVLGRLHGFWSLPAVESGRVYICDHSCFSYPGPRMVNGVELLACLLHPVATTGFHVQEAAMKLNLKHGQRVAPDELPKHFKRCL